MKVLLLLKIFLLHCLVWIPVYIALKLKRANINHHTCFELRLRVWPLCVGDEYLRGSREHYKATIRYSSVLRPSTQTCLAPLAITKCWSRVDRKLYNLFLLKNLNLQWLQNTLLSSLHHLCRRIVSTLL